MSFSVASTVVPVMAELVCNGSLMLHDDLIRSIISCVKIDDTCIDNAVYSSLSIEHLEALDMKFNRNSNKFERQNKEIILSQNPNYDGAKKSFKRKKDNLKNALPPTNEKVFYVL